MPREPIDFNLIYRDKASAAFTRVAEAAEQHAEIMRRAQEARAANAALEAATDDLIDEVYPPYDGDGEPV